MHFFISLCCLLKTLFKPNTNFSLPVKLIDKYKWFPCVLFMHIDLFEEALTRRVTMLNELPSSFFSVYSDPFSLSRSGHVSFSFSSLPSQVEFSFLLFHHRTTSPSSHLLQYLRTSSHLHSMAVCGLLGNQVLALTWSLILWSFVGEIFWVSGTQRGPCSFLDGLPEFIKAVKII